MKGGGCGETTDVAMWCGDPAVGRGWGTPEFRNQIKAFRGFRGSLGLDSEVFTTPSRINAKIQGTQSYLGIRNQRASTV